MGAADMPEHFNLNDICPWINNWGAIREDDISTTNEEIAILLEVNLAEQLSPILLLQRVSKEK